jgi:hypothetical protein
MNLKAYLLYSENHSKLVHFNEQKIALKNLA